LARAAPCGLCSDAGMEVFCAGGDGGVFLKKLSLATAGNTTTTLTNYFEMEN